MLILSVKLLLDLLGSSHIPKKYGGPAFVMALRCTILSIAYSSFGLVLPFIFILCFVYFIQYEIRQEFDS